MKLHGLFQNAVKYREAVIFFLTLPTLGPNISAHRFFPDMRFALLNSKYIIVSHVSEFRIASKVFKTIMLNIFIGTTQFFLVMIKRIQAVF